jgi:class 3 adenylate cyclase/tetratricopeptide (TPR) repeat protein
MICSSCGAPAETSARFCAGCGRPLRAVDDERRVITVVFADLVGFTALSERLDPERVKNLVDRCFDRLAGDVTTFGGQVDKIVGDALVALFGAPTAHEDDAERAVRAALRMQVTLHEEAAEIGHDLQIRVGVNTGEALVGSMHAAGSVTAMGDVVNTASRLQTSAAPGEVLVGPATHACTHRTIAYEGRGALAARGREEPVETWRAVAPTLPPGSRPRRVDVPLVGRDHEVGLLHHAVDTSIIHERALLVLLIGDVGMGKSRLADEVGARAQASHDTVLREGRCLPYGEANVWWPIADAMSTGFGLDESDGIDAARRSVGAQVATVMGRPSTDAEVTRVTEGLLTLLGYDPPAGADPATVRQESGRAAAVYADALAARRPLILALSDLHWADDAVLELIDDVFTTVQHRPMVVLATARPSLLERWSPRPGRHNTLVLHVDALSRTAAADLLETLVGQPVPPEVANVVLDRSGGNPFFLEELVSLMDGAADGDDEANGDGLERVASMPDTLRGLVAARLDDLEPPVRAVLQNAAVIGQQGPAVGLREMAAAAGRTDDIDAALDRLVTEEIMVLEDDHWSFRSDLVRQVAYSTVTKADRGASHLDIARYLEHKAAEGGHRPVWLVDQLAHHYATGLSLVAELGPLGRATATADLGELTERARHWVVHAAERARRDRALPTAIRLFGQALALEDPDGAVAPEETARLHLARAEVAVEAWDLATARQDLVAVDTLLDRADHPSLSCRGLVLRGRVEHLEGDADRAVATLTEAVHRYELDDDDAGRAEALRQRGVVEIFTRRFTEAEASATAARAAFEQIGDRAGEAWALQNLAWIAFVTGRTDEADGRVEAAVEVFSDLVDTRGMAWSLGLLAWIRFQQGRVAEATTLADRVVEEAQSRNDPWATAMMTLLTGSIRLWSGATDEAVELAGRSRRSFQTLGDDYGLGQASAVLGRSLVMVGRADEGFALLDEAAATEHGVGGRGQLARYARIVTALQVGEPDRVAEAVDQLASPAEVGGDDPAAAFGLRALQQGDLVAAERHLGPGGSSTTDPNLVAVRALLVTASGEAGAAALADGVGDLPGATYFDRSLAALAAALGALAGGQPSEAAGWIEGARSLVGVTDDRVAQMVVELAAAEVAAATGASDRDEVRAEAERQVAALGVEPEGWRSLFALARRALPA